ncbi:MAG: AIPR family protein [Proteobacteria bacterium]|nr:AIPR family protein [Pseudomonadota bacterium]MBS0572744.1 AIPR family protein [Pseudomonadota bacterium]
MTIGHGSHKSVFELPYNLIRNLTSPNEKANGVQTWFANVDAREILGLDTRDNLRAYIAEHSPSKRNFVHKQIENTIKELPDRFINRNSGVTITCTKCEIDDDRRVARLEGPSIINGAQTQGEIRRYFTESGDDGTDVDFMVRAEIIMEPRQEEIVEIAIARNTATSVKSVSQAGARGYLTELAASIRAALGEEIQLSETDVSGLNTQSVLQQTRLLLPVGLLNGGGGSRNAAYKQAGKCLTDFSNWAQQRSTDGVAERLYGFFVQMAPIAIKEYRYWEAHQTWRGHNLHEYGKKGDKPVGGRAVRRDKATGKVNWVAPGILFPIMSALSAFVVERNGKWTLEKPPHTFDEAELVRRAVQQYRSMGRDVALMGRSEAAYDALSIYTDTIASVLAAQKTAQL